MVSFGFAGARMRVRRMHRVLGRRSRLQRFSASPLLIPQEGWKRSRYEPGTGLLQLFRAHSRLAIAAAIALAVLAVGLAVAGVSGGGAPQAPPPRAEPPLIRAGLQLAPLPGWKAAAAVPSLPGLRFDEPISLQARASDMRLVAGLLPAASPTMMPPDLLLRLQEPLGRPSVVDLEVGSQAYYYPRITVDGLAAPLDVYLIPTTAGIMTAACVAGGAGAPYYDCWKNVATLRLLEGRALRLGPDAAFRQRLPAAIATVDAARSEARGKLASRIPARQASSASRVAAAYDRVATSLLSVTPQSSKWARAIVTKLTAVGDAYRGVVGPLRRAEPATYARGRAIVHAREQRLERLIRNPELR